MRDWRIVGEWRDGGGEFLVVLGESPRDCVSRLREAVSDLTPGELAAIASSWFEHLVFDGEQRRWNWTAFEELPLPIVLAAQGRRGSLVDVWERQRKYACEQGALVETP